MANFVSVHEVYNYVKEKITNKDYFPGNRITEEELARELCTSRTTVRSAIARLNFDGFVDVIPKKGAYVAKPSIIDMHHMYDVRRILETEAIRRAIPRMTQDSLSAMELCLQEQQNLEGHFKVSDYVELNRRFHWEIVKAADNQYLEKYLLELFNKTAIFIIFYDPSTTGINSIKTHTDIFNAIKARNVQAAVEALLEDNRLAKNCIEI